MHKVCGAFLRKEFHYALGHHTAKAVDLADGSGIYFPDGLQRTEMFCQQCRRLVADVANAKAKQQLVQIVLF